MKALHHLYRELRKEGRQAAQSEPDERGEIVKNVREGLHSLAQEMIQKLEIAGACLQKEVEGILVELQELSGGASPAAHRTSLYRGVFYLGLTLLIILGEFWLVSWTLQPYAHGIERLVIAGSIVLVGIIAFEKYLDQMQKVQPESVKKCILNLLVIALIGLVSAGLLLAFVRGEFLKAQSAAEDLSGKVRLAERFYGNTAFMPAIMGILAVCLAIISGIALHEGLSRVIQSGTYLSLAKKHQRLNKQIETTAIRIREWESVPERGTTEFMKGLEEGKARKNLQKKPHERFVTSPYFILLMALLLVLLIVALAGADEVDSVLILIDTSKSSLCKSYVGQTEFKENVSFVPGVIEKLQPGSYFRVVGITDESFGNARVFIKRVQLPTEKGVFGERLARAKLDLIDRWKKVNIESIAKETDIIGALNLASIMLNAEQGGKKLIILSDMRNTKYVNLENPSVIKYGLLMEVEKQGLIPDLKDVKVRALGVSSCGKNLKYWTSLKRFWEEFFKKAGANLQAFSIERRWE
jgi:phosphate/sulfate permease